MQLLELRQTVDARPIEAETFSAQNELHFVEGTRQED